MKLPSIKNQAVNAVIRGILHAVILSLVLFLLFAVLIWMGLPSGLNKPGIEIIKILSIFWGVIVALRHIEKHGWLFVALVGLMYMVLIFFIFSIISPEFGLISGLLTNILFACLVGAFSAMILKTLRTQTV